MGSTRVLGNRDKAVMYDGTTEVAFGPVFRGEVNAKSELNEFLNWLPDKPRSYENSQLSSLMVAFKVEKGWLDRADWLSQVEEAESLIGREIN